MASLPQELINYIVDQLDEYSSLTSCALSLFIYTELYRHGHPASDSLTAFPHLATYIRVLKIDFVPDDLESEALESILRAVRNLECLVIFGVGMRWTSFPPTLRMAIQDIITLPSVYGLHLVSIDDPHPVSFTARRTQDWIPSNHTHVVLPIGIRNLTSMKPPTHLDNLLQYTAFAANTVREIADSFEIPFLASTATLVLAILKCVESTKSNKDVRIVRLAN
ncbi:hypothetical protein C8J57DRAFT_1526113 [Mycena rebaudengoi]|nr:hypothetical protein C8J57DRAFT_1526113 [Mycena rebaudengoi]